MVAGPDSTNPAGTGGGGPVDRLWFVGLLALGLVLSAGGGGTAVMAPAARRASAGKTSTPLLLPPSAVTTAEIAPAATEIAPAAAETAPADHRVVIRLMGTFSLLYDGTDYAPRLRKRPLQALLFLYVLTLGVEGERRRPSRHSIAEELYPGLDPSTQDRRMRSLIRHRKRGLADAVSGLIVDDGKTLGFDLDNCLVDAYALLSAAKECELDPELHSETLRRAVVRTLERSEGRFLDFWEELAQGATGRRGATEGLVREVRIRLDRARTDLLLAAGRNALWRKDAAGAIPSLEQAHELRSDRDDVAGALVQAYEDVGRSTEAADLRQAHGV